jgi:hypothetical protein
MVHIFIFFFKEVEIERPQKPPIELLVKKKNMTKRYFENMLGTDCVFYCPGEFL